ncbi:MAG: GNAT family N-acetyltransferase [Bacteroidota bacterium]
MKEVQIRFIREGELETLVELCGLHAEFEKAAYDPAGKAERLRQYLFAKQPALYALVAEVEGEVVGYATYMKQFATWDAGQYLYMDCLFLREAARGLGIGEQLIRRIQEEGKSLGCSLIQWQTPAFNQRAMKFYERIGAEGKSKERYFLEI